MTKLTEAQRVSADVHKRNTHEESNHRRPDGRRRSGGHRRNMVGVATPANADYAWVADQSADICNYLSLQKSVPSTDWVTLSISMLQSTQNVSRAEAVAGIRQAATSYCPQHLSVVPAR